MKSPFKGALAIDVAAATANVTFTDGAAHAKLGEINALYPTAIKPRLLPAPALTKLTLPFEGDAPWGTCLKMARELTANRLVLHFEPFALTVLVEKQYELTLRLYVNELQASHARLVDGVRKCNAVLSSSGGR